VKWARNLVACALIAAFVFYCAAGCFGSSQAMGEHEAWRKLIASPQDFGLNSEVVSFSSLDGIPLRGWWLPAERASRGNLVLAHGRDANRSYMLSRARFLVRAEYNVLAIDLRLHGESGVGTLPRAISRPRISWEQFTTCESMVSALRSPS